MSNITSATEQPVKKEVNQGMDATQWVATRKLDGENYRYMVVESMVRITWSKAYLQRRKAEEGLDIKSVGTART